MPKTLRILFLEDTHLDAELSIAALEEAGYSCEWERVDRREDFLRRLDESDYDLILSDFSLPTFDGLSAVKLFGELDLTIPFILISGTLDEEAAIESLRAGATDFVLKAKLFRLPIVVERALEHARKQKQVKQAEKQIRLQAAALESAANAIVITDRHGSVTFINPAFTSLTGYSSGEVLDQDLKMLNSGEQDPAFFKDLWDTILAGQAWHGELINRRKDGSFYVEEQTITPLRNDAGEIINFIAVKQDVTERNRIETENALLAEQVSAERNRLNKIVASVPGIVWESWDKPDVDGQLLNFVSHHVEEMVGYSVEEWLSQPDLWLSIVHPDDKDRAARESAEAFASGNAAPIEFRWITKDGQVIWVEVHSALILDEKGIAVGVRGVTNDITERKRAESALRESEENFRELAANVSEVFYLVSPDLNKMLYVSPAYEQIWGRTTKSLYADPRQWIDAILPDDRERVTTAFARLAQHEPSLNIEFRIARADGAVRWISNRAYQVRGSAGSVIRITGISSDITDRKEADEALAASEERYRDLVENAIDMIYTHDLSGNYTSINQAGERLTGYTREESLARNFSDIVAPEYLELAEQMLAHKISGGESTTYELEIVARDGRRITVEVNTRMTLEDGKPVGVQGIARDITERNQLAEQLRQAQKMEAIGVLAGGVAHDFNNVLTAISGYSDLALRKIAADSPIRHYITEIQDAGVRAAALTAQLLAFSRKQVLRPKVHNLNSVIAGVERMLKRIVKENIEFRILLDPELRNIKADPGQIEQVIMNLVINAGDAMSRGGLLTIETQNIYLDADYVSQHNEIVPGWFVKMVFTDTGEGMEPEVLQRLFEPFYTTKEFGKGTGLGLSTVYGIVKQSGGDITVYSEVGNGTTFKVYFPCADNGPNQQPAAVNKREQITATETILLVEDDVTVRNLVYNVLISESYVVMEADTGEAALAICRVHKGKIDLLISDVIMPSMGGAELKSEIVKTRPDIKMLFMSGYTGETVAQTGFLDAGTAFLEKPFTPDALCRKVREVLSS